MTMQPVESSNIHSVGYDEPTNTLRVRFHSGNTYEYPNIAPEQHAAVLAAESKGKHFHKHLRVREHRKVAS